MKNKKIRIEEDALGKVKIEATRYYGITTQRSLDNLPKDLDLMPKELIKAIILIKKIAAITNQKLNLFEKQLKVKYTDINSKEERIVKLEGKNIRSLIVLSCDILRHNMNYFFEKDFPLSIWQSGSGTQTNMNVNEVISGVANDLLPFCSQRKINIKKPSEKETKDIEDFLISDLPKKFVFQSTTVSLEENAETDSSSYYVRKKDIIHPNDHINKSQSSNDTIITAIQISGIKLISENLFPAIVKFVLCLEEKKEKYKYTSKVGRTHFQEATLMTVGQEFGGYLEQILLHIRSFVNSYDTLKTLPQGGTAIGTGLNSHKDFGQVFCKELSQLQFFNTHPQSGQPKKLTIEEIIVNLKKTMSKSKSLQSCIKLFNQNPFFQSSENYFAGISGNDSIILVSNNIMCIATVIHKMVSDFIFYSADKVSEYKLPKEDFGSSIMPGKINPIQCESIRMMCTDVISSCKTILSSGLHSNLQLNTFRPLVGYHFIRSIKLLTQSLNSLTDKVYKNFELDEDELLRSVQNCKSILTLFAPKYGYDFITKLMLTAKNKNIPIVKILIQKGMIKDEKELQNIIKNQCGVRYSLRKID